jgi:hypothetical protein
MRDQNSNAIPREKMPPAPVRLHQMFEAHSVGESAGPHILQRIRIEALIA